MSEWTRALRTWRTRRRRFEEEWRFHAAMAASELTSLGLSRAKASRAVSLRLGSRRKHRTEALAAIGGDFRGLLALLPLAPLKRSPEFAPVLLAISVLLLLALNPHREQLIQSVAGLLPWMPSPQVARWVPLTPAGAAPMGFAALALAALLGAGTLRIVVNLASLSGHWRGSYAAFTLAALAITGGITWAAVLQLLLARRWSSDLLQGASLAAFALLWTLAGYRAFAHWWRDASRRCPTCLRLPGLPETHGRADRLLLEPRTVESVCMRGHGPANESYWEEGFRL